MKIDNIEIDPKILSVKFSCDYEKCKGACCNAPLQDTNLNGGLLSHTEALEILYHRKELSLLRKDFEDSYLIIERPIQKEGDEFFTTLRNEKCVFCDMQKGTCILKDAKKKIASIDIPLSCQLYPICLTCDKEGNKKLQLDHLFDRYCACGYEKGEKDNVYLIDFLKEPIIRGFGSVFYLRLKVAQTEL